MRTLTTTALVALCLALGGCGGTLNQGLETVHQPVVRRTDYVIDVNAGGNGLASGERERLAGWLASMNVGYGDKISIDDRDPYANAGAREAVAALAAHYGLLMSDSAPVTAGEVAPGTVRVVVSRTNASVPECPDWSRGSTDFSSGQMSNYGCATSVNLAAMVANPEDLIKGQDPIGGTDARTANKAIKLYRDRDLTGANGLKQETTKGGK